MDQAALRALANKLEEVLGMPHADVLVSALPPAGWDDIATRRDIDGLDARLDRIERSIDGMRSQFVVLFSAANAGLVVALVQLS